MDSQTKIDPRWIIAKYNELYARAAITKNQQRKLFIAARLRWLKSLYTRRTGRMIL